MKEWKTYKLEDLLSTPVRNGLTKPSSIRGKGVKMIGMGELFANEIIRDIEMPRVPTTESELKLSSIEKGDLLFARQSLTLEGAGKCSLVKEVTEPTVFESHIIRCRVNKSLVLPEYLYYYFRSRFGRYKIECIVEQVAAAGIRGKDLIKIEIPVPDIQTQRGIVDCLSTLDEKIHYNSLINDNLEQQAQALYKSWFVDFEPFKDGEFVESEFGLIPKTWRVGALSDLAEITMGQSPSGKSYNENGDGMLFYQGRAEFGERYPSIRLYTTEPSRIAEQNSVLLSVRAPVGDTNIAFNKCCIGRGLASIKAKHGFNSFIFYMIKSLKDQFDMYNGEGTVFGSINRDSLNSMKVIVPTNDVISDFEKIVAPLDFKYKSLFTENLLLTQQRDTLLPKLMSGELKINEIDC